MTCKKCKEEIKNKDVSAKLTPDGNQIDVMVECECGHRMWCFVDPERMVDE